MSENNKQKTASILPLLSSFTENDILDLIDQLNISSEAHLIVTNSVCKSVYSEEKLCSDIISELNNFNGRISLDQLTLFLDVDVVSIERCIKIIISSESKYFFIGQDLLSLDYVHQVFDDVYYDVLFNGKRSIGEIATNYNIDNVIYPKKSLAYDSSFISGSLQAQEKPANIQTIASRYTISVPTVTDVLIEDIKQNILHGTQSSLIFTPTIHEELKTNTCASFFLSNFYLPDTMAKQYQIKNMKAFLSNYCPREDLVELSSCITTISFIKDFEAYMYDMLREDDCYYLDGSAYFPSSFTDEDITAVYQQIPSISREYDGHSFAFTCQEIYLVRSEIITNIVNILCKEKDNTVKQYLLLHPVSIQKVNEEEEEDIKPKRKGKKDISSEMEIYNKLVIEAKQGKDINYRLEMKKTAGEMEEWWKNFQLYVKFLDAIARNIELYAYYTKCIHIYIKNNLQMVVNYFFYQNSQEPKNVTNIQQLPAILKPLPKDQASYLSSLYSSFYSTSTSPVYIQQYMDIYINMNQIGAPMFRLLDRKQYRQLVHGIKLTTQQGISTVTSTTIGVSVIPDICVLLAIKSIDAIPYIDREHPERSASLLNYLLSIIDEEGYNKESYMTNMMFVMDGINTQEEEHMKTALMEIYTYAMKK
ncbi:hypothetical protein WA158_002010 [Blastocystis sp. Blastoise]